MGLNQMLAVRRGITSVIGGGGKTTLLRVLGEELAEQGHTVLLCTTTRLYPFPGLAALYSPSEDALRRLLQSHRIAAAGTPVPGTGKLTAPDLPMERLAALAEYVLVEADGSAGRPMKAHASHEPVIPPETGQTILVMGASGFGQPIAQAAHRPERYARLAGVSPDARITPEIASRVLLAENLHDRVYVNQVETPEQVTAAGRLKNLLRCPVLGGELRKERRHLSCW